MTIDADKQAAGADSRLSVEQLMSPATGADAVDASDDCADKDPFGNDAGIGAGANSEARRSPWMVSIPLPTALAAATLFVVALAAAIFFFRLYPRAEALYFGGGERGENSAAKLQQVWNALVGDYYRAVDEDAMIESAASGIAASLGDAYTEYLPRDAMEQFSERNSGHYAGIGAYVAMDGERRLSVTAVFRGSPADLGGVLPGDVIASVDGVSASDIGGSDEVVERMRGLVGTAVSIEFFRPSTGGSYVAEMVRSDVKMKNVSAAMLRLGQESDESARQAQGSGQGQGPASDVSREPAAAGVPGGEIEETGVVETDAIEEIWMPSDVTGLDARLDIGYVALAMFDQDASADVESFVARLLELGAQGIVMDLRGNPGGNFIEAVEIADLLIGDGLIVSVKSRDEKKDYVSSPEKLAAPLKILVDGDSASASEIVAAAVKENDAGEIVGEKTFGKGLVQAVVSLADGSGLKYTQSEYFTPSGSNIHGIGVEPDIAVALPEQYAGVSIAAVPLADDAQLLAALAGF